MIKVKALTRLLEGDVHKDKFYGKILLSFHAGELRTVEVLPKAMEWTEIEHLLKVKTELEKCIDTGK